MLRPVKQETFRKATDCYSMSCLLLDLNLYRTIYGDPALSDRYGFRAVPSIHILVKNGNVVLEGVVANASDKNIAGLRANGVPGVFSVTNDLVAESELAR